MCIRDSTAGANDITLANGNDFGGAVNIVSANNVTLNDVNALTVGGSIGNNFTALAGGAATLNALTVGGNMFVSAIGIVDTANIIVTGTTTLAGGGGNIVLDNNNN